MFDLTSDPQGKRTRDPPSAVETLPTRKAKIVRVRVEARQLQVLSVDRSPKWPYDYNRDPPNGIRKHVKASLSR